MQKPIPRHPASPLPLVAPSLALLGVLTAIDAMSIDSYVPALPLIARTMGVSPMAIQGTLSLFLLGIGLGQAFWGPLSDRLGRRGPLLAGLVIYCLGALGCALAPSVGWLSLARFIQAIGASSGLVLARAIVADIWPEERTARIYSLLMQVLGVTALVSPLAGAGLLSLAGWRSIFLVLLLVGAGSLAWSALDIRESLPPRGPAGGGALLAGYARVARRPAFLLATVAASLGTAAMFATLSGSSFLFVTHFGWTSGEFSLLYAGSALVFIGVCEINQRALHRRSADELLRLAVTLQVAGAAVLALLLLAPGGVQAWGFALGWIALMGNLGLLLGNSVAVAMRLAPARDAGTASAVIGITQFALSAAVAPLATLSANLPACFAMTTLGCAVLAWGATRWALSGQR
jgi:MFS transporter, DHA1 family, multidrug resistance protein